MTCAGHVSQFTDNQQNKQQLLQLFTSESTCNSASVTCEYLLEMHRQGTQSAPDNWPIIGRYQLIQKKLILLSYLSYLFGLRLLSKDSFLLEGLQSADKTKTHPKAKLQNAHTFTGNGSHSRVCLLLLLKMKTCTYHLCKQQSADTNVLIGRYRLSAKRPIIGQYRLSADYWCISNIYERHL